MELDVHLSKDGEVIVAHDTDFTRMCGSPLKLADTDYADFPPMKQTFSSHFSTKMYDLHPDDDGKFSTLRQVFEISESKLINIDVKGTRSQELILKVNDLIKEFKREHLTCWGSMRPADHKLCRKTNPNIPSFYTITQALMTYIVYFLGFLWLAPTMGDAFCTAYITKY